MVSEQCQVLMCSNSFNTCASDKACIAAATCWNKGGGSKCVPNNSSGAALNSLIKCIQDKCSNVPTSVTCAGKCGKVIDKAWCQCDKDCGKYKDCCPDYALLCSN